tara:strand:- start:183 stop:1481 length:1299 start_codon:yes stop_codon:yes gene_type:complete
MRAARRLMREEDASRSLSPEDFPQEKMTWETADGVSYDPTKNGYAVWKESLEGAKKMEDDMRFYAANLIKFIRHKYEEENYKGTYKMHFTETHNLILDSYDYTINGCSWSNGGRDGWKLSDNEGDICGAIYHWQDNDKEGTNPTLNTKMAFQFMYDVANNKHGAEVLEAVSFYGAGWVPVSKTVEKINKGINFPSADRPIKFSLKITHVATKMKDSMALGPSSADAKRRCIANYGENALKERRTMVSLHITVDGREKCGCHSGTISANVHEFDKWFRFTCPVCKGSTLRDVEKPKVLRDIIDDEYEGQICRWQDEMGRYMNFHEVEVPAMYSDINDESLQHEEHGSLYYQHPTRTRKEWKPMEVIDIMRQAHDNIGHDYKDNFPMLCRCGHHIHDKDALLIDRSNLGCWNCVEDDAKPPYPLKKKEIGDDEE